MAPAHARRAAPSHRRAGGARAAIRNQGSDAEAIVEPLDSGFLDDSDRALWAHYQQENAHRDDPFHLRYYRNFTGALRTRSLRSVVDLAVWRRSRHYNDYIRACRLDDRITSSMSIPGSTPRTTGCVVLHRAAADGWFPHRALQLTHLLRAELLPMLGRRLALPGADEPGSLPRQLVRVLECLACGDSEKQAAARLGLSVHTVNRHVQRLYRRFGVHSRGELMFRCRDVVTALMARGAGTEPGLT